MANQNPSNGAVIVPDSFKSNSMASAFQALEADSLSEGITQSYGIISFRGKTWALRYQGQTKPFLRADDGSPSPHIDVVILGAGKGKSKSYYKSFSTNSEGERPLCSSIDGIVPDAGVKEQQNDNCALCPRNKWQMQPSGRMGRECTDYKRLAVLVLPSMTKPTLGYELMEPVFLRVPPDSLQPLAAMDTAMDKAGYKKYFSYITRISFDPQKHHPRMIFKPLQALTNKEAPAILELCRDPMVARIIGGDTANAEMQEVTMQPAGTQPTGITPAPVTVEVIPPAPKASPTTTNGGGGVTGDDLDKRIAALLSK